MRAGGVGGLCAWSSTDQVGQLLNKCSLFLSSTIQQHPSSTPINLSPRRLISLNYRGLRIGPRHHPPPVPDACVDPRPKTTEQCKSHQPGLSSGTKYATRSKGHQSHFCSSRPTAISHQLQPPYTSLIVLFASGH